MRLKMAKMLTDHPQLTDLTLKTGGQGGRTVERTSKKGSMNEVNNL